jgi:superfamily I DNA/RNA helicase
LGNIIQTAEFNAGLERLTSDDRHRVYDAIGKVLRDSRAAGLQIKKMQRVELWEIRASQDLRIIAKLDGGDVFCFSVGHHDATLARAERMQTLSESERKKIVRRASDYVPAPTEGKPSRLLRGPLAAFTDDELTAAFGIPPDWVAALRSLETQEQVLDCGIEDAISEEQFWELIECFATPSVISTGAKPVYRVSSEAIAKAFAAGEIEQLEFNLPPSSWAIVDSPRRSPQLIKGGPGSGKTLIALYRALHVMETPSLLGIPRVLYVTYTKQLRDDAVEKIRRLRAKAPSGLEILTFDQVVNRLAGKKYRPTFDETTLARAAAEAVAGTTIEPVFFSSEVADVIEWRNVRNFDEYAKLARKGRGERLTQAERRIVWESYERFGAILAAQGLQTLGAARIAAAQVAEALNEAERYDFIVVDEVQDLPRSVLAMVVALSKGEGKSKHVMLVGDAGQSIYQHGFRWADVGLRLGGANVHNLAQSERSTQEILDFGRSLLGDAAGAETAALPASSSKHGALPRVVHGFRSSDHRRAFMADEIAERVQGGASPARFAVIAHGRKELLALEVEFKERSLPTAMFQTAGFYRDRAVKLITAHSAKGLEFPEVYVPDANAGTYPFYKNADLPDDEREEFDAQDCALFYVACTRAADALTVLYDREPSPFLVATGDAATDCDVASGRR